MIVFVVPSIGHSFLGPSRSFTHPFRVLSSACLFFGLFEHTYFGFGYPFFVIEYPAQVRRLMMILPSGSILLCRSLCTQTLVFSFQFVLLDLDALRPLVSDAQAWHCFMKAAVVIPDAPAAFFDLQHACSCCAFLLLCFEPKTVFLPTSCFFIGF